jgi:hypothetical protein
VVEAAAAYGAGGELFWIKPLFMSFIQEEIHPKGPVFQ